MKYIRWDEYYAMAEDLHKKIGTINVEPFPKKWTRKMRKKQNEANRSE